VGRAQHRYFQLVTAASRPHPLCPYCSPRLPPTHPIFPFHSSPSSKYRITKKSRTYDGGKSRDKLPVERRCRLKIVVKDVKLVLLRIFNINQSKLDAMPPTEINHWYKIGTKTGTKQVQKRRYKSGTNLYNQRAENVPSLKKKLK
jgi:hypothetical protein